MNQHAGGPRGAPSRPAQPDAKVIEALFTRLRTPLRRYFERRGMPLDEIDDLVQQVFLQISGRDGIHSLERLEAYLFATASNLLRDRHRRRSSRAADVHESYDEQVHGGLQTAPGPDRALLGAQLVEQLVVALYELPERTRVVFTLYHLEDLSHRAISQRLGIAVSTIEKHMARAIAHLLKRLDAS